MTDLSNSSHTALRRSSVWIRQFHRWVSIAFTLSVIITFIALALPEPVVWISYIPLLPLFLLMGTGLYMFALPYLARWRASRRAGL